MKDKGENNKEKQLKEHLGYLIRAARLDTKMSQESLAKAVKTKQPAIARAEKNGCDLSFALRCLSKMGFTLDTNNMRAIDPFKKGLTFIS